MLFSAKSINELLNENGRFGVGISRALSHGFELPAIKWHGLSALTSFEGICLAGSPLVGPSRSLLLEAPLAHPLVDMT